MTAEYTYTCAHRARRRFYDLLHPWERPKFLDFHGQSIEPPVELAIDLRLCPGCRDNVIIADWHIDLAAPRGESVVERGEVLVLGVPMEPDPA